MNTTNGQSLVECQKDLAYFIAVQSFIIIMMVLRCQGRTLGKMVSFMQTLSSNGGFEEQKPNNNFSKGGA